MTTILTDIEGTTSSIAFVKDVLFPYARRELPRFVREHGDEPAVRQWLDSVATENGGICSDDVIVETLQGWIDQDRKHTALKALQGMLWRDGYVRGDFRGHIYPDAAEALQRWHREGRRLAVFSSGSVDAQQLLFGHSEAGDLTPLFSAFFDTRIGHKREPGSYRGIAEALQDDPGDVVFLSDVVEELDAARDAGLRTILLDRPRDYPHPRTGAAANGHARATTFGEIELEA
ncbi:MAG: mtnC [Xanthomonadaceae bacterium]|nr:mtnC [Xanthomonadaceae bacterium]